MATRWMLCAALALAPTASAATYYIDYAAGVDTNNGTAMATSWKRHPAMKGFAGTYTHRAGDTFVFKGGVTWPVANYPWNITQSGANGTPDLYTTNRSWFAGASFAQPVFDDGSAHPGGVGLLHATNARYLTFNDLAFTKCGASQVADQDKCLVFENTSDITLTNNTFTTYSWIAVYFVFTDGASHSNFNFTGNDWSHTSGAIWFASAAANTNMHNVNYSNNAFHDFASQIGGGVHGDGALHFFVIPHNDSTQYADNVTFCGNRFYGDFRNSFGGGGAMTAFFFVEGGLSGLLCNNDMSFSPVQPNMFDGLIVLAARGNSHADNLQIYNNSMTNIGANSMSAAIHIVEGYKRITLKNNIASGMSYPVYVEDAAGVGPTFVSDYNLWNGTSGQLVFGSAFQSHAQWQAAGRDTHGVLGVDPGWVAAPGNQLLKAGSPAIAKGLNLASLNLGPVSLDRAGAVRPASGTWDMGAYRYQGATASAPNPPSGMAAVVRVK
jgi:hypothetical protein